MNKDFIETCKLLKKHYTRLVRTDANSQSDDEIYEPNITEEIINEAKQLLLNEQLHALSDNDIEHIRQNSVVKYAKTLENFIKPTISVQRYNNCLKNNTLWNTHIFDSDLKNTSNSDAIKTENLDIENMVFKKDNPSNCLQSQFFDFQNEKAYLDELKSMQREKNEKQVNECIDNILKINITENIDQILNKNSVDENIVKLHKKIKHEILKEYEELTETLKKRFKTTHLQNEISKMSRKDSDNFNDIDIDIQEWRKEATKSVDIENMENKEDAKHVLFEEEKNGESIQNNTCSRNDNEILDNNDKINENFASDSTENIIVKKCKITIVNNEKETINNEDNFNINETQNNEIKVLTFNDIPELHIIPQNQAKIEDFLEISKIQLVNENNKQKPITSQEILRNSFTKWKNIKKQEPNATLIIPSKKIEEFIENFKNYKAIATKSKSDLMKSNSSVQETVKSKPKSCTSLGNKAVSFENRFKVQKSIIEAQKAKLAEQERIIQELKLNKIKILAEESYKNAKQELRKSFPNISKNKSTKKIEEKPNNEETEENGLSKSLNLMKAPKIVQCMEDRAREREERRLLIKERKRLMEEEKKRQTEEAIQRKMKEEIEEKQKRLEKLKEQRRIARELEMKKQQEKQHFIEINEKAYAHYKKRLISISMKKMKILIINMRLQVEMAKRFYEESLVKKHFQKWRLFRETLINNRTNTAVNFYTNTLLRKCFDEIKELYLKRRRDEQVAIDRYELSLQSKYFIAWHALVCQLHIQNRINLSKAEKKYSRNLMFQCFFSWRKLPDVLAIERVYNERKRVWRLRVAEILPDYDPMKDADDE